jgi:hypothetical protein
MCSRIRQTVISRVEKKTEREESVSKSLKQNSDRRTSNQIIYNRKGFKMINILPNLIFLGSCKVIESF